MLGDLMTSVQPIEIKIFGDNTIRLKEFAARIGSIVNKVEGAADVFNGIVISGPSVSIIPDNAMLAQYGLSPQSLQNQVQLALQGIAAGNILEKEQLSTVRLVYPDSRQERVDGIRRLSIFLPSGKLIPVTSVATVTVNEGEAEIQRENLESMGVISARLEKRDLGSVMAEIRHRISSEIVLPQGYHIVYGGAYAEQQQSFRELLLILITSSLLVFSVYYFYSGISGLHCPSYSLP